MPEDNSLTPSEYDVMRVELYGAQPLWDYEERAYTLKMRGHVVAKGNTVKECWYRHKRYPIENPQPRGENDR